MVEERRSGKKTGATGTIGPQGGPRSIAEVEIKAEERSSIGLNELDRVLGGGMVPGAAVLIGGDPGIGKSTLLLQAMVGYARGGHNVLYVSGEESTRQIRLRAERLGELPKSLMVWAETAIERVVEVAREARPEVMVIDSVQTLFSESLESSPGSVGQVREVSSRIINLAKQLEVPVFIVGHVTKDGAIAGPRVLEHMVDTVLYFEGKSSNIYRILRAVKNRFGSVMEIGVFEMKGDGLHEVKNPSQVFLQDRPQGVSGSCVVSSLEGTRTVLVEVQALVAPTLFGVPRRTTVGVDYNKVLLLLAVLEKKADISLTNHDIFLKVAGGLRVDEPAIDLGVLIALASNFLDKPVDPDTVLIGEVGLAGELRAVTQAEARIREAAKLGFTKCVMPLDNMQGLSGLKGIELMGIKTIKEAVDELLGKRVVAG